MNQPPEPRADVRAFLDSLSEVLCRRRLPGIVIVFHEGAAVVAHHIECALGPLCRVDAMIAREVLGFMNGAIPVVVQGLLQRVRSAPPAAPEEEGN